MRNAITAAAIFADFAPIPFGQVLQGRSAPVSAELTFLRANAIHKHSSKTGISVDRLVLPNSAASVPISDAKASDNDKIRRPDPVYLVRVSGFLRLRSELSSLARCSGFVQFRARTRRSARLDINCLGGLHGLGGLLDREMQHTLVEMSFDGSLFRLER